MTHAHTAFAAPSIKPVSEKQVRTNFAGICQSLGVYVGNITVQIVGSGAYARQISDGWDATAARAHSPMVVGAQTAAIFSHVVGEHSDRSCTGAKVTLVVRDDGNGYNDEQFSSAIREFLTLHEERVRSHEEVRAVRSRVLQRA